MSLRLTNINKEHTRMVVTGTVISLALPMIAWMLDAMGSSQAVSVSSIIHLHTIHPSIFLVDLCPILAGFILYSVYHNKEKEQLKVEQAVHRLNERIDKNADFAKRIGEGDYTSPFITLGDDDALGKSLLLMRDNLLLNTQK